MTEHIAIWHRLVDAEQAVRDCTESGHRVPPVWEATRNMLRDLYADLYAQGRPDVVACKLSAYLGEERAIPIKFARMGEHSWVDGRKIDHSGYA